MSSHSDINDVITVEDLTRNADHETLSLLGEVAAMQVKNTAERIGVKHMGAETVDALRAVIELQYQAPLDLCGEQREYMLPRIKTLYLFLLKRFPHYAAEAMEGCVDGWGEPIGK